MADVGKVSEDKSLPDPKGPKKNSDLEKDKFRDMMKVDKTDPDEQKKRKSQTEAEEEFAANLKSGTPKQGLGEEKGPSLYEPSGPKTPPPPQPPPEGSLPPSSPPPAAPPPSYPPENVGEDTTFETTDSQKSNKKKKKKAEEAPAPTPPKKKEPTLSPKEIEALEKVKAKKKKHPAPPPKKDAQEMPPPKIPSTQETLPSGAWEAAKPSEIEEKKKKKEGMIEAETSPQTPDKETGGPSAPTSSPLQPLAAPFANLPPQVQAIFERMVGVMTVMNNTGITETTLFLDNPQFEKSVFYGSQIVLTEFSTAPKAFNVELIGKPEATNLFAANAEDLVAAFQGGGYNFKVNRVETSLLTELKTAKKKKAGRVQRKKNGGG